MKGIFIMKCTKKILSGLIAAVMSLTVLSGCGDEDQPEETVSSTAETTPAVTTAATAATTAAATVTEAVSEPEPEPAPEHEVVVDYSYVKKDAATGTHFVSNDMVTEQCSECGKAAEFAALIKAVAARLRLCDTSWIKTYTYNNSIENPKEGDTIYDQLNIKLVELEENMYYSIRNHECSAETITVEDYPYVCGTYYGTYTGEWKGIAPCGKGTFNGTKLYDDESVFKDKKKEEGKEYNKNRRKYESYSYTGEWSGGLPDGQGAYCYRCYPEDQSAYFEEYYEGGMNANKRDGEGTLTVFRDGPYFKNEKVYYGKGQYRKGILQKKVNYAVYDDEGLKSTGIASNMYEDVLYPYIVGYKTIYPYECTYDRAAAAKKKESELKDIKTLGATLAGLGLGAYLFYKMSSGDKEISYEAGTEADTEYAQNVWEVNHDADRERAIQLQQEADARAERDREDAEATYNYLKKYDPNEVNKDTRDAAIAAGYNPLWH